MGQQQMLLIILGIVVIGVAIAIGITLFSSSNIDSNKSSIVEDLSMLGSNAYQYKMQVRSYGGGGGSYSGYIIPQKLASNDNATYSVTVQSKSVTLKATSTQGFGTISAVIDSAGTIGNFDFKGEFQ